MNNEEYKISAKQIKMLQTLYHRAGMDEDTRRNMLSELTNGRTDSTKDLTAHEAKTLIARLLPAAMTDSKLEESAKKKPYLDKQTNESKPWPSRYEVTDMEKVAELANREYEAKAVLRAIYLLSLQISFLNKGYDSTDHDEIMINRAKLNKWVREKTVYKKNLTQMKIEELKGVKKQLEAIAAKERKKELVTVNQ